MRRLAPFLALLVATAAAAQQKPIYDPDDFVDPRDHDQPVFISRLVFAGVNGYIDDYRALGRNAEFLHLINTLYRHSWQFDYKHAEAHAKPLPLFRCDCQPPIYFPTLPPPDATPNAPPPGSKDTLQAGWYQEVPRKFGPSYAVRYRMTYSRQQFDVPLRSVTTEQVVNHRSGHEQSIGLEADTRLPIAGHDVWGSLSYARTWNGGAISPRTQQEFSYTARPPGLAIGPMLAHATLTVAGVTNRGGTALNVVNPAFEVFWRHDATSVNVHLVWSPQTMRDGETHWKTHNQVALFVDRALWVHLFGQRH